MLLLLFGGCNTVLIATVKHYYFKSEIFKRCFLRWKQLWKKFLDAKNLKKLLILKDICPEYLKLELHANGSKTVTTANVQLLLKLTATFTAHAQNKFIAKQHFHYKVVNGYFIFKNQAQFFFIISFSMPIWLL